MKIWTLNVDFGDFQSFELQNSDKQFKKEFRKKIESGTPQNGELDNLELIELDSGEVCDMPKFWTCGGTLLFSKRAKEILCDLLLDCVEFIPMKFQDTTLYLVNILRILDAVNYEKAELEIFPSGSVIGIIKSSFIVSKIKGVNMFKVMLKEHIYLTEIYVSTEFKTKVEENHLTGFRFTEVWDSDVEAIY